MSTCGTKLLQRIIGWLDFTLQSRLTGPFPKARSKDFSPKVGKGGTLGLGVTGLFCKEKEAVVAIAIGSVSYLSMHLAISRTSSVSSSEDRYKSSTEQVLSISMSYSWKLLCNRRHRLY